MLIAVTGGNGRIGQAVCAELRLHGHQTRTVDIGRVYQPEDRYRRADLRELWQVSDALADVDAIIHLAGVGAPGTSAYPLLAEQSTFETNTVTTYNVFRVAAELGIRRIVWSSSETVLGFPFTATAPDYLPLDERHPSRPEYSYALAKAMGEQIADYISRKSGLSITGLRFSVVLGEEDYGDMSRYWDDPKAAQWNFWSYVDIRDVVTSCRVAIESGLEGANNFLIAAPDTLMNRPTAELLRENFPDLGVPTGLGGFQSLQSTDRAEAVLGHRPRRSWREYIAAGSVQLSAPRNRNGSAMAPSILYKRRNRSDSGDMEIPMRHPTPVPAGAHIRVISPSWPVLHHARKEARRAEQVLATLGLRVSYGAHATAITDDGRAAGTPRQRAADFMEAFTDPSVDAVFSACGGGSTRELIPFLDVEKLRAEQKAFIGNSDNVWLHQYLRQEAGLTSYYGVTYIPELGEDLFPETFESFRCALMSPDDIACLPPDRRSHDPRFRTDWPPRRLNVDGGWHWVRPGHGRGPLLGAEIGILIEMVEHFDLKLDGCVLFWDVGLFSTESAHAQFAELADRVPLDGLAGMMVGPDARHTPEAWAKAVTDIMSSVLPDATYPILVNADIGHLDPKWVVPYGREVLLDSSGGVTFPRQDPW